MKEYTRRATSKIEGNAWMLRYNGVTEWTNRTHARQRYHQLVYRPRVHQRLGAGSTTKGYTIQRSRRLVERARGATVSRISPRYGTSFLSWSACFLPSQKRCYEASLAILSGVSTFSLALYLFSNADDLQVFFWERLRERAPRSRRRNTLDDDEDEGGDKRRGEDDIREIRYNGPEGG